MFTKTEIKVGEFYQIVNNKLKKNGIKLGEYVYTAGSTYQQNDKRDPHNFRKFFLIAKTDEDGHIITDNSYLVDPSCLGILPEYEVERLKNLYEEDFKSEESDAPSN